MANQSAYKAGDDIFRSEPWVYSILASKAPFYCYHCFLPNLIQLTTEKFKKCSGCYFAHYCSEQCQKLDWKERHKPECKMLHQVGVDANPHLIEHFDRLLILAKILPKLQRGEVTESLGHCAPGSSRSFFDLMSHKQEYSVSRPDLLYAYNILKRYLDSMNRNSKHCCDYDSFLDLLGRFNINNFSIYSLENSTITTVGRGLYLGASVLDHSCIPNAIHCDVGIQLVIKAITNIDNLKDIRIAYTSPFELPKIRRAYLETQYFFTCTCPACADPDEIAARNSVACTGAPACTAALPAILPSATQPTLPSVRCPACGVDNTERITVASNVLQQLEACILDCKGEETDNRIGQCRNLQSLVATAEGVLHRTNLTLGVAQKTVADLLKSMGAMENLYTPYLLKCLPPRRLYARDYSLSTYVTIFDWMVDQNHIREAKEFSEQTEQELRIVPGTGSPVYKFWLSHTIAVQRS